MILLPLCSALHQRLKPIPISFLGSITLWDSCQMLWDLIWSHCDSDISRAVAIRQISLLAGPLFPCYENRNISFITEISQWHYSFKISLDCSTSLLSSARTGLPFCLAVLQIIMDYRVHVCTALILDCKTRHVWGKRVIWQWNNPYHVVKDIHYLTFSFFTIENLR